jgi:hypothetical protein
MTSSLLAGEATSDYVIMPASEIRYSGTLIGFEYVTHAAGSLEFYVSSNECSLYSVKN